MISEKCLDIAKHHFFFFFLIGNIAKHLKQFLLSLGNLTTLKYPLIHKGSFFMTNKKNLQRPVGIWSPQNTSSVKPPCLAWMTTSQFPSRESYSNYSLTPKNILNTPYEGTLAPDNLNRWPTQEMTTLPVTQPWKPFELVSYQTFNS